MRIEAAPPVFRFDDRRPRPNVRRDDAGDRREPGRQQARAAMPAGEAHVWFHPALGAHILGQVAPERVSAAVVSRAYAQPEAKTPLRPRQDRTA